MKPGKDDAAARAILAETATTRYMVGAVAMGAIYTEAAAAHGMPFGTVATRVRGARVALRAVIRGRHK